MDELGRSLREAFEQEQAELGSLAGARERVMQGAFAARRTGPRRTLRLAGGMIAVLLAAAIVGTLLVARLGGHAQPAGPGPTAVPTATPALPTPTAPPPGQQTQPLAVPGSEAVLLFRGSGDRTQLDGITWDGRTAGRVADVNPQLGAIQNPAGTLYEVTDADGTVYDRSGARVATGAPPRESWLWADDGSRSSCRIEHASPLPPVNGEPATLTLAAPGQADRAIAHLGTVYQQTGVAVVACSVQGDRAVVVQATGGTSASQVWVVHLSSGAVIWTHSLPGAGAMAHVSASHDGSYVAVVTQACCQAGRPGPPSTTIYGRDGAVVGQVAGAVEGFSWDGTLAVVSAPAVSVIRWLNGAVVWTAPAGLTLVDSRPEPGGQRVAISLGDPAVPQTTGFSLYDLYAVGPEGQAKILARQVTS